MVALMTKTKLAPDAVDSTEMMALIVSPEISLGILSPS
jgi:hypothetical protein